MQSGRSIFALLTGQLIGVAKTTRAEILAANDDIGAVPELNLC